MKNISIIQFKNESVIKITFNFNYDDLAKVKSLPLRKYFSKEKYWTAPLNDENIQTLQGWGFIPDNEILKYSNCILEPLLEHKNSKHIPGLKKELFPYQKIGVNFIEQHNGKALLADEMGLGKTPQTLAYLQLHPELRPAIIVVPASLKLNWKREAEIWMENPKVEVISGGKPYKTRGEILIINYDILTPWVPYLSKILPKVIIGDEIHAIKNTKAKRTKAMKKLVKPVNHFIAISGTPIVNRPIEFYNAISMVNPMLFPSQWKFAHRYCGAKHNGFGWDFNGASNTQELHEILQSIMIRRKKSEVLTELPNKLYSFVPIELDNEMEYKRAENDFIKWVKVTKGEKAAIKASGAVTLTKIEGLKQLAVNGKLKQCVEWIRDFLESGEKLVVFATHKIVIDRLMEEFKGCAVKIDGSVSTISRQGAVDKFQNDPKITLFVGNIKAAGVGITLTTASNVAFLELPWSPGDLSQSEDRCHRIGQKKSVVIHYLLAVNTIEEKIAELLDSKRGVLDSVLDGVDTPSENMIGTLLNAYK